MEGELTRLSCQHIYHTTCLAQCRAQWKNHCPLCRTKLDSLNRMLHRLSPSDHLFGGVLRSISKWSNEKIETHDALWEALSDMNRCAQANSTDRPRLRAVK